MPVLQLSSGDRIEIFISDHEPMNWTAANAVCAELGQGWRIPTIFELKEIFSHKSEFDFANYGYGDYWSSEATGENTVRCINGVDGSVYACEKDGSQYIRLVRSL